MSSRPGHYNAALQKAATKFIGVAMAEAAKQTLTVEE